MSTDLPRFAVVVEPDAVARSSRGSISGRIHVEVGGYRFPEANGSDLIVATLVGWLAAIWDGRDGGSIQLRFLDGPLWVEFEARPAGRPLIRCVHDSRSREVVCEHGVEGREVVSSILAAARQILSECATRQWQSADLRRAQELVTRIEGRSRSPRSASEGERQR